MSPHELHADWLNKQKLMSETTTTTRKTRVRKPNAPHITALKQAVSKALKNEWLLQQALIKHSNACDRALAKVAKLTLDAWESWRAVQARSVDCANAHNMINKT
jgi:hypothetical protein